MKKRFCNDPAKLDNPSADWDKFDGVLIQTHMTLADDRQEVERLRRLSQRANVLGKDVYLLIDYFVQNPYHGPPPHHGIAAAKNYPLVLPAAHYEWKQFRNPRGRHQAYGYMHFAWTEGWQWGEEAVAELIRHARPRYIQQADNPEYLDGWDYYAPNGGPPTYNDTMGVFDGGYSKVGFDGVHVVSGFKSRSLSHARGRFGPSRAAWKGDFEFAKMTYKEPDVPDDDPVDGPDNPVTIEGIEETLYELENRMNRSQLVGNPKQRLRRIEKDQLVLMRAMHIMLQQTSALVEDVFGDD